MNFKKVALCLLISMGLATSSTMGVNASAVTENEVASTTEEQNQGNVEYDESYDGGLVEEISTNANLEYGVRISKKKPKYTKADLRLMSAIIYCEANAEPYAGKKAVGIVVMNRVKSKNHPNTIRGVLYQRGQFSPTWNGSMNRALANWDAGRFNSAAAKQCIRAAKEALEGDKKVKVGGKTKNLSGYRYFSGRMSNPRYRIGGHMFK